MPAVAGALRKRDDDAGARVAERRAERVGAQQRAPVELDRERLPVADDREGPRVRAGRPRELDPVPAGQAPGSAPDPPVIGQRGGPPAGIRRRWRRRRRRVVEPDAREERAALRLEERRVRRAAEERCSERGERGPGPPLTGRVSKSGGSVDVRFAVKVQSVELRSASTCRSRVPFSVAFSPPGLTTTSMCTRGADGVREAERAVDRGDLAAVRLRRVVGDEAGHRRCGDAGRRRERHA